MSNEQDFRVTLVNTGLETMTGGRVVKVKPYIDEDLFMVTYEDGLADVNIRDGEKIKEDKIVSAGFFVLC